MFFTQRRKGAKRSFRNAAALCVFAPLRERDLFVICIFVFLCCSAQGLIAQTTQQPAERHSYKIDLKIDFDNLTYTGVERVRWINRGDKPTSIIYFHLYPNLRAGDQQFPAARVNPSAGEVTWMIGE